MACVGCPMAAFETLVEAAQVYGLTPEAVLQELCGADTDRMSQLRVPTRSPKGRGSEAHS